MRFINIKDNLQRKNCSNLILSFKRDIHSIGIDLIISYRTKNG